MVRLLTLLALCAVASACTASDAEIQGTIRSTVADTLVVESGSSKAEAADTLVLKAEFGATEDSAMIGGIQSIAFGPHGSILIADRTDGSILQVRDGALVRRYGRSGDGPGEFRTISAIAYDSATGRIHVRDMVARRVVTLDSVGTYISTAPAPSGELRDNQALRVARNGDRILGLVQREGLGLEAGSSALVRSRQPMFEQTDTSFVPTAYYRGCEPQYLRSSVRVLVQPAPAVQWTISKDGGLVVGCSGSYQIDWYRRDGTVLRIRRRWQPQEISSRERRERKAVFERTMRREAPDFRWPADQPYPRSHTAFEELFAAEDDKLWVLVVVGSTRSERSDGTPRWRNEYGFDVFSADGQFERHIRLPERMTMSARPVFLGDSVWASYEGGGVPRASYFHRVCCTDKRSHYRTEDVLTKTQPLC